MHSDCNEKQLKTALSDIIRTNQVRALAIIYSVEAVFTIAFCLLVHFNLVTSWPRSLMGNMLATGLRGAGFASGCNFCFFVFFLF